MFLFLRGEVVKGLMPELYEKTSSWYALRKDGRTICYRNMAYVLAMAYSERNGNHGYYWTKEFERLKEMIEDGTLVKV